MKKVYIFIESCGFNIIMFDIRANKMESEAYHPFKNNFIIKNDEYKYLSEYILKKMLEVGVDKKEIEEFAIIIQDASLSIKDVEVLEGSNKNELENIVDIEMMQNFKIDMQDFEKDLLSEKESRGRFFIDFKNKIQRYEKNLMKGYERNLKRIEVLIFPKKYNELARELSVQSGIFCGGVYLEYQLIHEFLKVRNLLEDGRNTVINLRKEDILLVFFNEKKLTSSVVLEENFIDKDLLEYLNSLDVNFLMTDFENTNYEFLSKNMDKVHELDINFEEKIFFLESRIGKTNYIKNYYNQKSGFSEVLRYVNSIMALFLAFFIISGLNVYTKNISLNSELETLEKESYMIEGKNDGLSRKNISRIIDVLNYFSGNIVSMDMDEKKMDIEIKAKNLNEIGRFSELKKLKDFNILSITKKYIKTESEDRNNINDKSKEKGVEDKVIQENKGDDSVKKNESLIEKKDENSGKNLKNNSILKDENYVYEKEVIEGVSYLKNDKYYSIREGKVKLTDGVGGFEVINLAADKTSDGAEKIYKDEEYEFYIKLRMKFR